jgi:hypothetical protein
MRQYKNPAYCSYCDVSCKHCNIRFPFVFEGETDLTTFKIVRLRKEWRGSSNTRRNFCRTHSNVRIFSYVASNCKRFESPCIWPLAYRTKPYWFEIKRNCNLRSIRILNKIFRKNVFKPMYFAVHQMNFSFSEAICSSRKYMSSRHRKSEK